MKKISIIILLALWTTLLFSQNDFVFHRDKPFYVTGDVVWYTVKLPNSLSDKDIAINTYVADSKGEIQLQYFSKKLNGNQIKGYFNIPYDWRSDIYQLALFAKAEKSTSEMMLSKIEIPIYNDLDPGDIEIVDEIVFTHDSSMDPINLSTSSEIVSPRATNELNLRQTGWTDLAVSVYDSQLFEDVPYSSVSIKADQIKESVIQWTSTPYITGIVKDENEAPLRVNVLGAYDMNTQTMLYSKSDKTGAWRLDMPEFYGSKDVHFHPYLFNEYDRMSVDIMDNIGSESTNKIRIDSSIIEYINYSQDRKKVYQQFGQIGNEINPEPVKYDVKELKPNRIFKISDYQNFDNIAAFFNEILASELSFVAGDDGKWQARMYNPRNRKNQNRNESSYFEISPIFIVDGKVTKDADKIGRLPLDNIETAGLYYKQENIKDDFGTFGGTPFVVISTSYPDYQLVADEEADIISINGYQPEVDYPALSASDLAQPHPIFRPMIHWNPAVSNTSQPYTIRQSDDVSEFQVIVTGRDADGQVKVATAKYQSGYIK